MRHTLYFTADGHRLRGVLHLPETPRPPLVVGSHGLLGSADSPKQLALAQLCESRGLAYFRFDHRGCGQSEGDFGKDTSFEGRRQDLIRAIETARSHLKADTPLGLFGSSLGGAVCLSIAPFPPVRALVTAAAPLYSESIHAPFVNDPAHGPAVAALDRKRLFFDLRRELANIRRILIFHGDADPIVPFDNALALYEGAGDPKRLIRHAGGDHPMTDPGHQAEFLRLALEWYARFLAGPV